MKIAICDDDYNVINQLKTLVQIYSAQHRLDVLIDCFNSGESFLLSREKYDIIVLDYQMKKIDGLETARQIRRNNNCSAIIFLTNYPDFVFEAFKVNTFRFLKKPLVTEELYNALDDYFAMFGDDYPIIINYERVNTTVLTNEIIYLEANNKQCTLYTVEGMLKCSKPMGNVAEQLPRSHFYRVNRFYIVNFNYISKYDDKNIYLSGDKSVHVTRNYLTAFKNAYREYSNLKNVKRTEKRGCSID